MRQTQYCRPNDTESVVFRGSTVGEQLKALPICSKGSRRDRFGSNSPEVRCASTIADVPTKLIQAVCASPAGAHPRRREVRPVGTVPPSSPPIAFWPVGVVHVRKDLRHFLRAVLVPECDPCRLEPRLGFIQRLGVTIRRSGNVDADRPQPPPRVIVPWHSGCGQSAGRLRERCSRSDRSGAG